MTIFVRKIPQIKTKCQNLKRSCSNILFNYFDSMLLSSLNLKIRASLKSSDYYWPDPEPTALWAMGQVSNFTELFLIWKNHNMIVPSLRLPGKILDCLLPNPGLMSQSQSTPVEYQTCSMCNPSSKIQWPKWCDTMITWYELTSKILLVDQTIIFLDCIFLLWNNKWG